MQIGFQPLKANTDNDVAMLLFNRFVDNVAKAFKLIEQKAGAAGGLATLDADGVVPDDELGGVVNPATLHVSVTAAVNTAATATLPAVGGKFHYITRVELVKLYNVVGVAAGAGVIVTSTNLPGNPAWTTEQNASPAGTAVKVLDLNFSGNPLRALAGGTQTTFVAPAQLQTIWRWNVSYLVAT